MTSKKITIKNLPKSNIVDSFTRIKLPDGKDLWTPHFIQTSFFDRVSDFKQFLGENLHKIDDFPLDALIWAYGNYKETDKIDYDVIEAIYFFPRKWCMIPLGRTNLRMIALSDELLNIYFKNFFSKDTCYKMISKKLKQALEYEEIKNQNINDDVVSFLTEIFYQFGKAKLSKIFGHVLYRSNRVMERTVSAHLLEEFCLTSKSIIFKPKLKGIHFGVIIESKNHTFYAKFHSNYPVEIANIDIPSLSSSPSFNLMTYISNVPTCGIGSIRSINIKELFTYKVLEFISYGPKTSFAYDKNIYSYLMVVTQGESRLTTFDTIDKSSFSINIKSGFEKLLKIVKSKRCPTNEGAEKFIVNLTFLDIIARCMILTDFNSSNFGLVTPFPNYGTNIEHFMPFVVDFKISEHTRDANNSYVNSQIPDQEKKQKLKDFLKSKELKYIDTLVYIDFINANKNLKYDDHFLGIFKPDYSEDVDFFYQKKRAYGKIAMDIINQNKVQNILDSQFQYFKGYLNELSEKVLVANKDNLIQDLSYYVSSIKWNIDYLSNELQSFSKTDKWEV